MSLFKLIAEGAVLPERATKGSVGFDLVAISRTWNDAQTQITYDTGVALEDVPEGHFAAIFPRSSIIKTDLRLANSVGVIDPDYTDSIKVVFDAPLSAAMVVSPGNLNIYAVGDKIAQIVFLPFLVGGTVTTIREGGFGSTDKKKNRQTDKPTEA